MKEPVSVREVMNREFIGASESDGLLETTELLIRENEPSAVVLRGNDPIGVLGTQDVLASFVSEANPDSATVGDAMTESVPSLPPDAGLPEARDRMAAWDTEWALVVEEGEPLGTLTGTDILSTARLESEATEQVADRERVATAGRNGATNDSFEEQGICSACGTLTRNLASFNGQLLCPDCRDV